MAHGGIRIAPILEVSTFSEGQSLAIPGTPQIVHLPGHTPGMAANHLPKRNVVLTGDPRVTRNPLTGRRGPQIMPRPFNRSGEQALESLEHLESLGAAGVMPGHGDPRIAGATDGVAKARTAGYS
jgi:glyoxylase-like metal-dependent hydrolase (beta-lactamase superfamily II)